MIDDERGIEGEEEYEVYKPWWRWLIMVGLFAIIGLGIWFHLWSNY